MELNYKELLRKYIEHVGMCEGIDFLGDSWRCDGEFSDEEWAELQLIAGNKP